MGKNKKKYSYQEVLRNIDEDDMNVIKKIYQMRYLTYEQILEWMYLENYKDTAQAKRFTTILVNRLLNYECVDEITLSTKSKAYFLKQRAIEIMLEKGVLQLEIYDDETNEVKSGYSRAHELTMAENLLEHQSLLNQFALNVERLIRRKYPTFNYKYLDEREVTKTYQFKSDRFDPKRPYVVDYTIKPDGLFVLEDVDVIVEMDTGKETTPILMEKWKKYNNYFKSVKGQERKRRLVVLFVLGRTKHNGKNSFTKRKKIVWNTLAQSYLNLNEKNFDVAVGDMAEMQNYFENNFLTDKVEQADKKIESLFKEKFNCNVSEVDSLTKEIDERHEYNYLLTLKGSDNQTLLESGRQQIFIVQHQLQDSYKKITNIIGYYNFRSKFLAKKRAALLKRENIATLNKEKKLEVVQRYSKAVTPFQITVISSVEKSYLDSEQSNLHDSIDVQTLIEKGEPQGFYYTTYQLLKEAETLEEALFTFGKNNTMNFYTDLSFTKIKKRMKFKSF